MPYPNFTPEIELSLREFIREKVAATLPGMHIFTTAFYFGSPQDFAATVSEKDLFAAGNYKVRYVMVTFNSFVDARTKGCDDNPSLFPSYNIQLFRETSEARDGLANSHDDTVRDMILLRNAFLRNRDVVDNQIVHEALVMQGAMAQVSFSEYVIDILGEAINFKLTFEVN